MGRSDTVHPRPEHVPLDGAIIILQRNCVIALEFQFHF